MNAIDLVLYILAAVLFALAALLPEPLAYRLRIVAAGLFFAVLVLLVNLIHSFG